MKIEKIEICNLTAIEGEQVIDFTAEPLRSAGLFAITGDTGSGKSTILDAICMALYNRAPRFDSAERIPRNDIAGTVSGAQAVPVNDVRGILRRGCREGWCRVTFTTASGERYEAQWTLRVKRTGTYDNSHRSLRRLAPKKEAFDEKEIDTLLPQIIGLDYTQFTRTVMLAQNSFANFLRARREEKSALLEKLTGTEIYGRVSQAVHQMAADAIKAQSEMEHLIAGILHDRLPDVEVQALNEEQRLTTATMATIDEQMERALQQQKWFADVERTTADVERLEQEHAAANKAYRALGADEAELARYDAVVAVQPLYQEIEMRRRDIAALKQRQAQSQSRITLVQQRMDEAAKALQTAQGQVDEADTALAQRRPAISRGHVLTGEMAEAESQCKKAREMLRTATVLHEESSVARQSKEKKSNDIHMQLEQAAQHKQALAVHRMMFEKYDLIKDKIALFYTETQRNEEAHRKALMLQRRQTSIKASLDKYEKTRHDQEDQLSTLRSELLIHRQNNAGRDSTGLQQRFADSRNRLLSLERAQALWQRISAGYAEIEEKRAEVSRMAASQIQMKNSVERAERELEVRREAFKRTSVALTLSQSENIVSLRKQLKEGTACPVCGATHHPYHTETERELGELLNNLDREYREATEDIAAREEKLDELKRNIAIGEGTIAAERANLERCEQRQRDDVEEWSVCAHLDPSFADCSPTVARHARRLMIGMLIDNTRRAAEEAEKELATYNYHQTHINRLNEQITALEASMAESRARIDDLNTQYQIASAAADDTEEVVTLSERSCSQLYTDLDEMVTISGWFTEWKNNPDGFRMRIIALYNDWTATCRHADSLQRSEELLAEEIKAAISRENEARQQKNRAAEQYAVLTDTLQRKKDEFAALFGSSTPEKEEERLQRAVMQTRQIWTQARQACDAAAAELSLLQGSLQNMADALLKQQDELAEKTSALDLWILRFNADNPPLQYAELQSIFSDPRDRRTIRDRIMMAKENMTLAANRLEAARETLMKLQCVPHRPSGKGNETPEAIALTIDSHRREREALNQRLAKVNLRLMAHRESVRQAAEYEERRLEGQRDVEEWKRLDAFIGSADGRKFREMAQSYTFAYLTRLANRHLAHLSPRYALRNIPGTLVLEIIDHDMYDEHRYVYSLSGGETFVVSLALALALASLSSGGLAIGSLFIDEGFGNLDSASLDLVMNALSHLETIEGRKVGIISHTAQIRQQISPQIRLVKEGGSGRSRIEIG